MTSSDWPNDDYILDKLDTCFYRVLLTPIHTEFLSHIHPSIVFSYSEWPMMYTILDTFLYTALYRK